MKTHLTPSQWPGLWKILYIFLYGMSLVGLGFAGLIIALKIGHDPVSFLTYYRGNPEVFRYPKSAVNLAETSHFHTMIAPLLLTVLALPLPWTSAPLWLQRTAVGLAITGEILLVADPWILRYGPPFLVFIKYVGGICLVLGILFTGAIVIANFQAPRSHGQDEPL